MGAKTVHLTELSTENTEVIGFNGRGYNSGPSVGCGFSLPIVRHIPTGLCCVWSGTRKPALVWYTDEETRELVDAGQITLLPKMHRIENSQEINSKSEDLISESPMTKLVKPHQDKLVLAPEPQRLPLPRSWRDHQSLVLWVTGRFLRELDIGLPLGRLATWHKIENPTFSDEGLFVTCEDKEVLDGNTLSPWATTARSRFDSELIREHSPNWPFLHSVANHGLCAAQERGLRYWLYVRVCTSLYYDPSQPPETAAKVFRVFVEPAFPVTGWERFCNDMSLVIRRAQDLRHSGACAFSYGEPYEIARGGPSMSHYPFAEDWFRHGRVGQHGLIALPQDVLQSGARTLSHYWPSGVAGGGPFTYHFSFAEDWLRHGRFVEHRFITLPQGDLPVVPPEVAQRGLATE